MWGLGWLASGGLTLTLTLTQTLTLTLTLILTQNLTVIRWDDVTQPAALAEGPG